MTSPERTGDMTCRYCESEPEPGWIEMDNNGPIVRCPVCEHREKQSRTQTQRNP